MLPNLLNGALATQTSDIILEVNFYHFVIFTNHLNCFPWRILYICTYFETCIKRYGIPSIVSPVLYASHTNRSTQPGFFFALVFRKPFTWSTILLWAKNESRRPSSSSSSFSSMSRILLSIVSSITLSSTVLALTVLNGNSSVSFGAAGTSCGATNVRPCTFL